MSTARSVGLPSEAVCVRILNQQIASLAVMRLMKIRKNALIDIASQTAA